MIGNIWSPNVLECRWKYLRESSTRYFDADRNTSLAEYLGYIFNGYDFVYDKAISKDVITSRNPELDHRKFRPDARCEELNLIVEFDGTPHYQDANIILADKMKDEYLAKAGYHVVRIPYWIQLSTSAIYALFEPVANYITCPRDVDVCTLPFSFFNPDTKDPGLSISVGSMCELGRERFVQELQRLPDELQFQVYEDIMTCCIHVDSLLGSRSIIPANVLDEWGVEEKYWPDRKFTLESNLVEYLLFHRPLTVSSYIHGVDSWDLSYTEYLNINNILRNISASEILVHRADEFDTLADDYFHTIEALCKSDACSMQLTGVSTWHQNTPYKYFLNGFVVAYDKKPAISFIDKYKKALNIEVAEWGNCIMILW